MITDNEKRKWLPPLIEVKELLMDIIMTSGDGMGLEDDKIWSDDPEIFFN